MENHSTGKTRMRPAEIIRPILGFFILFAMMGSGCSPKETWYWIGKGGSFEDIGKMATMEDYKLYSGPDLPDNQLARIRICRSILNIKKIDNNENVEVFNKELNRRGTIIFAALPGRHTIWVSYKDSTPSDLREVSFDAQAGHKYFIEEVAHVDSKSTTRLVERTYSHYTFQTTGYWRLVSWHVKVTDMNTGTELSGVVK